jgi:uncharacterized protein DUF927
VTEAFSGSHDGIPRSSFERFEAAVFAAGLRVKDPRANHLMVECPTHADNNPSLSIDWKSERGKTEFFCHGGCGSDEAILAALELTVPMLFDDYEAPEVFAARRAREREEERRTGRRASSTKRTTRRPVRRAVESKPLPTLPKGRLPKRLTVVESRPLGEWQVTASYDYSDVGGTVIHQEVRHERPVEVLDPATSQVQEKTEKRFTQRWPDNTGGWVDKAPAGFVPVLYRLPDLGEWIASGRRIWLCEGAKDAERFLELGEAATTNPSGAGNFKPEQAAALAGAHVVLVIDHDLAGYRRGLKVAPMLDAAESVRIVLPVTSSRHEDASDHFNAGHGLDDFVDVTIEDLVLLERVAETEDAAMLAGQAAREAAARTQAAVEAAGKARAEDETRFAGRWAAEAAKHLVRAATAFESALQTGRAADELGERLVSAVRRCQDAARAAHEAAGVTMAEDLAEYLQDPAALVAEAAEPHARASEDADDVEDLDDGEGAGSNVVEHPTSARLPEPTTRIPMSRGTWAYELGGQNRRRRGVYLLNDNRWTFVAPLPYLHTRIVARDGYGRRTGTYYLVSAAKDGDRVIIGHDELVRHTWPNMLDLAISHDDKILKAATTALIFAADVETELVEATPRLGADGKVSAPVPETLPQGYLRVSALKRSEAIAEWHKLLDLVALSPRMALVLGASAIGPFLHGLGYQSHILSLYGEMNQGKSVTMEAAAAIWGNPGGEAAGGVLMSWNMSGQGPTSYLGELGTLPGFFDEHGMASPKTPGDWGDLIFRITQGASRGRPAPNGRIGFHSGRQWHGVLVSSGNSRLMDGIGAGDKAGTQRRVVELPAPFTESQEHSEAIEQLVPQIYGHLGHEILDRHSLETVGVLAQRAAELIGPFEHDSKTSQRMLEHMQAHVAGALLLDEICGTDDLLTAAAVAGAQEYLAEWTAPIHDADRIVDWLNDSLFREPARWPTVAQHLESVGVRAWDDEGGRSALPVGGIDRNRLGMVANDGSWIGMIPSAWEVMCADLGADSEVACRELVARGILLLQNSGSRHGNKTNQAVVKIGGKAQRVYKISYAHLVPDDVDELPTTGPDVDDTSSPCQPTEQPAGEQGAGRLDVADDEAQPALPDPEPDVEPEAMVTAESAEVTALVTGEVTGEVTGATPPLTCEVTGVTGVTGKISRTGARTRKNHPASVGSSSQPDPEIVRFGPDEPRQPCVVCGTDAGQLVDGEPLHLGPCADIRAQSDAGGSTSTTPPAHRPTPAAPTSAPTVAREARFTAPAAVLDAEGIHLADGTVRPLPAVAHFGDLAALTGRDQLRLGWGGGEDRLPDQGQIWLTASALEAFGLPVEQPALPDKALTKAQRAKETAKIYARLDDHPMVAGALEAGWQLGKGGHLDVWTRIWHPELLPGGALIVGLPWHRIEGVALFEDDPTPGELARRLLLFAQRVGVAYRITSAATGLDLIDHHRPPRRSIDDDRGQSRRRVALIRNTAAEIPPWRKKTTDARFTGLEQDFSWWREWDKLPEGEQGLRYVHGYDRNASYLVPWRSIELGVEDLVHHTGEAAAWDGKERPGYYLVDDGWEWPYWGLPDPGSAIGGRVGKGRVWVTVHTLKQLKAHGITPIVHESYTWGVTARYLEGPGIALSEARTSLSAAADSDPGAKAVLATVKGLYSATVGKLAAREHSADFHLWRPDWRDHVIGATKTAILHTLTKAHELSGVSPLVVDRDAVFYASDEPDPIRAWPGDPSKLGVGLGSWKPIGSAELATWGPQFLSKRAGRWHYGDAVDALGAAKERADER